ncbi:MAG: PrgI family protein [bacterium]|nr:PrgI family protein [bacterium]
MQILEGAYKQQHPIPQNVMQVEFKLIGNLTIRQFVYAAVGVVFFYIVITSPIPSFIRLPVAFLGLIGGLALAFLPLEDRGLDQWTKNFLAAIYSPTQRIWRKEPEPPEYFLSEYTTLVKAEAFAIAPSTARGRLAEYLATSEKKRALSTLDRREEDFFSRLNLESKTASGGVASPLPPPPIAPSELPGTQPSPPASSPTSEAPIATSQPPPLPVKEGVTIKTGSGAQEIPMYKNTLVGRKLTEVPIEGHLEIRPPPSAARSRIMPAVSTTPDSVMWEKVEDLQRTAAEAKTEAQEAVAKKASPVAVETNQQLMGELNRLKEEVNRLKNQPPPVSPPSRDTERLRQELLKTQSSLQEIKDKSRLTEETTMKAGVDKLILDLKQANKSYQDQLEIIKQENAKMENEAAKVKAEMDKVKTEATKTTEEKEIFAQKSAQLEERLTKIAEEKTKALAEMNRIRQKISTPAPSVASPEKAKVGPPPVPVQDSQPSPPPPPVPSELRPSPTESQPPKPLSQPPPPPTSDKEVPNVISGTVKDKEGKMVVGSLVIIKDSSSEPVRALKTNNLGQFSLSTALPSGTYTISIKSPGKNFAIMEVILTGKSVPPLEIRESVG